MMMRQSGGTDDNTGDGLWRFSLALYARPGVGDALIALQEHAASDVNLILFGLWLGVCGRRRLDATRLSAAAAAIAPLNSAAVMPLRRQRRQLKAAPDPDLQALRRRILGLELAAERRVQVRLAAQFSGAPDATPEGDGIDAAEANLTLILGNDARSPEARLLCQALAALTRAGRPGR